MEGLKGITINTPPENEAHIYAEDDAAIYASILGMDGVASIGKQCKATIVSNNLIKIEDGVVIVGGHIGRIIPGDEGRCEIENGQTGVNRNDLIVANFTTTGIGGTDTMSLEVIKGVPGAVAADPQYKKEDVYSNGKNRDLPLYRVKLQGLNIVEVEPLFNVIQDMTTINKSLSHINDYIVESGKINVSGNIYNYYEKYASGKLVQWGVANYSYTDGFGKITYPIPFVGGVEDYMLFVQGRYIPSKITEIMVAAKQTTSYGYAYALLVNNTRPDSHNFDWYAIGRWK